MAYGSSKAPGPKMDINMGDLLPYHTLLKDGTAVVLQRLIDLSSTPRKYKSLVGAQVKSGMTCTDPKAVQSAFILLNHEISQGNSYPFEEPLSREKFKEYFFGYDVFVLRTAASSLPSSSASAATAPSRQDSSNGSGGATEGTCTPLQFLPDPQFVGCFYVKPNYPGRSSHLCNSGFLVAPAFRGRGAGILLGERYRCIAQRLGYCGSVFNLVFHDNPASLRLWEKLQYTRIGVVPGAGKHPIVLGKGGKDDPHHYVDATMWFLDLTKPLSAIALPWEEKYAADIRALRAKAKERHEESKL